MADDIVTPSGRGRKKNVGRKRDVLRVAARLFGEQGYRQTTLDDISGELNITRPALYYYARSKDELLSECFDLACEELFAALAEAEKASTGVEQVRIFFLRYAEAACGDFGRCFVLTALSEMAEEQRRSVRGVQARLTKAVGAMVRKGIEDGTIRDCDADDVSTTLATVVNGIARWYNPRGKRAPAQIARDFLDLLFEGLRPR